MSERDGRLKSALVSAKRTVVQSAQSLPNRLRYRNRRPSIPEYDLGGKDVLMVVVDCLRADHLSPRYERETTPFLAGFEQSTAVSAAPRT